MNRRSKLLAALLILAAAAMVLQYITQKYNNAPVPLELAQNQNVILLTGMDPGSVVQVEIRFQDRVMTIRKEGDQVVLLDESQEHLDTRIMQKILESFPAIFAERIIEEEPVSLHQYGLEDPKAVITGESSSGLSAALKIGDAIPTGRGSYVQKADSTAVYVVPDYCIGIFLISPRDLLNRSIAAIDISNIQYIYVEVSGKKPFEIIRLDEEEINTDIFKLSEYYITRPYQEPRPADQIAISSLLNALPKTFLVAEFIENHLKDLSLYGLDEPRAEIFIQDLEETLHILVGDPARASLYYARTANSDRVFTINELDFPMLSLRAFDVVDKFAFIPRIDYVESVILQIPEAAYTGRIIREGTGETYTINEKPIDEGPFKSFYQALIRLIIDAENPGLKSSSQTEAAVTFILNSKPWKVVLEFHHYNDAFYALTTAGHKEFLISKSQVDAMITDVSYVYEHNRRPR